VCAGSFFERLDHRRILGRVSWPDADMNKAEIGQKLDASNYLAILVHF